MKKTLLKAKEAADYLNIGRSLMYEMINTGEIPCIRLGRCIRIPVAPLERWLEQRVNDQKGE